MYLDNKLCLLIRPPDSFTEGCSYEECRRIAPSLFDYEYNQLYNVDNIYSQNESTFTISHQYYW